MYKKNIIIDGEEIIYQKFSVNLTSTPYYKEKLGDICPFYHYVKKETVKYFKPKMFIKHFTLKVPNGLTPEEYVDELEKDKIHICETKNGKILFIAHGYYDGYIHINNKKYTLKDISKMFPKRKEMIIVCCWGKYITPYNESGYKLRAINLAEPILLRYWAGKDCVFLSTFSLTDRIINNIKFKYYDKDIETLII